MYFSKKAFLIKVAYFWMSVVFLSLLVEFVGRRKSNLAVGCVTSNRLLTHPQFVVGSHSTGLGVVAL